MLNHDYQNDQNFITAASPSVVDDYAKRSALLAGEEVVFRQHAAFIANARVLDIGVGGGRTSLHLMAACRSYIGVDYSSPMIAACQARFPFCADRFKVGDARTVSDVAEGPFDFILFAYTGIDSVGHEDRLLILRQVHGLLADEGLFFFSAHSLHAFPFSDPVAQARNAHLNPQELRQRGWVLLTDSRADVILYYAYPDFQVRQLEDAGFEVLGILDMRGEPFDIANPSRDWLLSYVCRKRN
jgi:SAM-dependent methyltransferase